MRLGAMALLRRIEIPADSRSRAGGIREATGDIDHPHLFRRASICHKELRARGDIGQALRSRDRDIEAVWREQEFDPAREVLAARRRHREEHDRRLLALELVHRTDSDLRW